MNRLWQKDSPIIRSLLETDVYKILMLYFIWRFFPSLEVRFAFTNRTTRVRLADEVDIAMVREQIAHVRTLAFTDAQIAHIRGWGMFPEAFLGALRTIHLPEVLVERTMDGQLRIEVSGLWFHTTLWELYVLPIVSECRTRFLVGEDMSRHADIIREGERRLREKIEVIRGLRWPIALFDLRRRLSGDWERHTTQMLLEEVPERISGISNVEASWEFGKEAQGTNAHEMPMALAALRGHEGPEAVRNSVFEVLEKWQLLYGHKALIMLPDTFGSEWFFQNLPRRFLEDWRGSRQDSGDPVVYGENRIRDYERAGIDPTTKLIIFSDGLTVGKMTEIERRFWGRILGAFGWGTNKVHDVPYVEPLSIVMKLVEAAGRPAIKLSDNLAKAVGDPEEVARMKRIFGYVTEFSEAPVV